MESVALRQVLGYHTHRWQSWWEMLLEKRDQFPSTSGAQEQRQEVVLPRRAQHKAVLFFTAPAIPGAINP